MKQLKIRLGCSEMLSRVVNINVWGQTTKVRGKTVERIEVVGETIYRQIAGRMRNGKDSI